MAGYRSKKIMADRYADPITLDHIIELRRKLAEAEQQRDNALAFIKPYRSALQHISVFYFPMTGVSWENHAKMLCQMAEDALNGRTK